MESELPEIGEVELADLINEMDDWDGTFTLPLGAADLSVARTEWLDAVQRKYEEAPLGKQAEADAEIERLAQGLRDVGVDLTDPAQAHAFAMGAYSVHNGVLDNLAEVCHQPSHPLLHLAQGGRFVALVARRAVT